MEHRLSCVIVLLLLTPLALGLMGYDCRGQGLNITTLSLLTTGDCEIPKTEPKEESVDVQLLQLSEYANTFVTQCRVEIDRTIYRCGMSSHVSVVHNGRREYIQEVTRSICRRLHETGEFYAGNNAHLTGFIGNSTSTRSIVLAGSLTNDGTCEGTQYSDFYGTWSKVVVQATIKVILKSFQAPIRNDRNQIILPSGQMCEVSKGNCIDNDGSNTYWSAIPPDNCHFSHYDVLYEGRATKLIPPNNQDPVIYTVTSKNTVFALAKRAETNICGYSLIQTEHPKLFILETRNHPGFAAKRPISVENLDIFTYVNSKFIYVEKHIRTQMTQLYQDVMTQKCLLEKQVLRQALTLAKIAPDEMAIEIMKEPGYTAVTAGEVIHIIKCLPVNCKIRKDERCYDELPVTHQNTSLFLSPKTRILTRHGTLRDCSPVLPTMFQLNGIWYKMIPRTIESSPPQIIQPLTRPQWNYVNPSELATDGIYTEEEIEKLHEQILFHMEKDNILHTVARGATGNNVPAGMIDFSTLLDEATLEKLAESTWKKLWKGFLTFGSVSAGILAIFMMVKVFKIILDTIIQGYALYEVYGCGVYMLGAIFSSVTNLLIRRANRQNPKNPSDTPLNEVVPVQSTDPISPEESLRQKGLLDN